MQVKLANTIVVLAALSLAACQTAGTGSSTKTAEAIKNSETTVALARPENPAPKNDKRPYAALIAKHAAANNVPLKLAHAVVFSESSYNAKARGAAGEIGLMQLRPATARMVGYKGSAKGLYNPETNIRYGMKYLGQAHRLSGGSTCGTILKYNAGHGAKRMNPISQRYCNKVSRLLKK